MVPNIRTITPPGRTRTHRKSSDNIQAGHILLIAHLHSRTSREARDEARGEVRV